MNRRVWLRSTGLGIPGLSGLLAGAQRSPRLPEHHKVKQGLPFPSDLHRPRFHFLAPRNWMNDPNGLAFYGGEYHVFYQHNPGGAVWGDMHWGHAVSKDLLQWRHLPMALAPTPGGYDKDGVFSGCLVVDGDTPTIVYTGTQPEVQAIATSSHPQLEAWTKWEKNPVISAPPAGLEVTGFRDPFVWKEGTDWLMALGSGVKGKGGMVLLYRSQDLRSWEYLHPLVSSDDSDLGTMWECPNFFPLGRKHVLLISPIPLRKAMYLIGEYRDRRFSIERMGSLDDGGHFYAPQVFVDGADRRVMFGWSWEGRSQEAQVAAGWAGALTLPRVLSMDDAGGLRMEPHPLCNRLHRFQTAVRNQPIGDPLNDEIRASGVAGNAGRLDVIIHPADARQIALSFYASPDRREETRLVWNRDAGQLVMDRSRSSLSDAQDRKQYVMPSVLSKGERLQLTVYLDRSMVEVYGSGASCLTTRVYPTLKESVEISLTSSGKKAMLQELVWRPIAMQVS